MGIHTSEIDSHAGRDGIACISFCARFSPGEMLFRCFYSYYALQLELCAPWIWLGLHTGWKRRIWGVSIIAYMPTYIWGLTPKYRLQSQSTLKNEINMRMYNFYFSPNFSALSHPVIFYTAFQFASFFFSNISSSCEQTSRNLNLKTKKKTQVFFASWDSENYSESACQNKEFPQCLPHQRPSEIKNLMVLKYYP